MPVPAVGAQAEQVDEGFVVRRRDLRNLLPRVERASVLQLVYDFLDDPEGRLLEAVKMLQLSAISLRLGQTIQYPASRWWRLRTLVRRVDLTRRAECPAAELLFERNRAQYCRMPVGVIGLLSGWYVVPRDPWLNTMNRNSWALGGQDGGLAG